MARTGGATRGVPMAWVVGGLLAAAALPLAGLLVAAERASRSALADVTARIGAASADAAAVRVEGRLRAAEESLLDVDAGVRSGLIRLDDPSSVSAALRAVLLRRPTLAEATFTAARILSDGPGGAPVLADAGRWQVAAERAVDGGISFRTTLRRGSGFVSAAAPSGAPEGAPPQERPAPDPTGHLTFVTPASARWRGTVLWSDLHRTQLDLALPEPRRRVVVTAQRSIDAADGTFAGVLRVSLAAGDLGGLLGESPDPDSGAMALLCDRRGRLVASADSAAPSVESDDGLRVDPSHVDPRAEAVLRAAVPPAGPLRGVRAEIAGQDWIASARCLDGTQDWLAVVALPSDAFARDLGRARRIALAVAAVAVLGVIAAAAWVLRAAGRALAGIAEDANRLRHLDFSPGGRRVAVREVGEVLDGIERAKAALRALGRFVPVDLVRGLVAADADPRPGGELREVTVLFSDIEGFTSLAESMPPAEVAALTSDSLASATAAVHASGGVVDKFIGDSVMALWNAPSPLTDHAAKACAAALAARDSERRLVGSPEWEGRPRIRTRFGLHTGRAVVGNIGSPERLNYTAVGDTVNLASRLEGLNKLYGTTILVSDAVRRDAGDRFDFRMVDHVAVAGRSASVAVHELLGPPGARTDVHGTYERALGAYRRREFAAAAALLGAQGDDRPSAVLRDRCLALAADPPPADWDGSFAAGSK